MNLGEATLAMEILIPLTVMYSIFFVMGLCGNLFTCIVIIKNEYMRWNTEKYLLILYSNYQNMLFRTTTNVYLLNLALTDMVTLVVFLPIELYEMWHQYPWMFSHAACDVKTVAQEAITYASILTVVSFSVER